MTSRAPRILPPAPCLAPGQPRRQGQPSAPARVAEPCSPATAPSAHGKAPPERPAQRPAPVPCDLQPPAPQSFTADAGRGPAGLWRIACLGLACLLLLLPALPAMAQDLPMRSGEHGAFTRLTLPVPPGRPWRLGRTDDGYGLRLEGPPVVIDDSAVFTRIARNRLAGLRRVDSGVDLIIGCACHIRAFTEDGLLVIDIRDGPAPPGARFEARLGGPIAAGNTASRPARSGLDWTRRMLGDASPGVSTDPLSLGATAPIPDPTQARDLLLHHFARAAAKGLIAGSLGEALRPDRTAPDTAQPASGTPSGDALQPTEATLPADPLRNLLIDAETAHDRARRGSFRADLTPDGARCLPDQLFALRDWGDDRPIGAQLADGRRALMGEFDRPEPAAVEALARLYLHLGFGAEAAELLRALPVDLADGDILADLAALMDEALPRPQARFAGMAGCDGEVALWAALAAPELPPGMQIDTAAVRRGFSALPVALRRHLGPPLAQRFLQMGDLETAQALRDATRRAPGLGAPGLDLVDAELARARGRPEEASATLAPVAASNTPDAAEALVALVDSRRAAGVPVDMATVENIAALAYQHRGTPKGARLARSEALGLALNRRFDAAFAVRDRLAEADATAAAALTAELLPILGDTADEVTFLSRLLSEDAWRGGAMPLDTRVQLAERLLAAGFPEVVAEALPAAETARPEERRLLARAALALSDPRGALRLVAGEAIPDLSREDDHADANETTRMRAAALAGLGEHRAAAAAYRAAGMPEDATRSAWLARDWERTATVADGVRAALAARRLPAPEIPGQGDAALPVPGDMSDAEADPDAEAEGALAAARTLLEEAAETRALLTALLAGAP